MSAIFAAGRILHFSVLTPDATSPNAMIYPAYLGAAELAAGLVVLGVGLIRKESESPT